MTTTLAAVFSTALMLAGPPDPQAPGSGAAMKSTAQADGDICWGWGWYEGCFYCGGPTYEMICETRCFYCPDTGETTCEPTGWECGGGGGQDSVGQDVFRFPSTAGAQPSCSSRL